MALRERRVSPADCALALAIPLTKAEFFGDLAEGAPKDFARSVARRLPALRREVLWDDHYGPLAGLVERVASDARAHGVTVATGVTLADLRALLARHAAVTLVAHWRFPPILPGDIVDAGEIVAALARPSCAVTRHLKEHLGAKQPDLLAPGAAAGRDPAALCASLAAALNDALEPTRLHYEGPRNPAPPGPDGAPAPPLRLTRVAVEEAFPRALRGGPAVELSERLHPVGDVVEAVPDGFDGVIDLSVCNSIILGEAIKRRRGACLVVVNERPAMLSFRMVRYKYIIRDLHREPARYTDVMIRLSEAVLDRRL
ncbi:uncharacterized protein SOCE26_025010 [Sorangium cellulosum]|uniref:Uncharacterized protein n=1 Tax=Sorangium cellulosum TaxID=56 RepID=A0A2L0EP79_SORCE|nr:hypothetical protein [Sorangium cellulosum]AUX41096.1 uncharacterized protein SOCE26_025010 [Sorangium cellulosum]